MLAQLTPRSRLRPPALGVALLAATIAGCSRPASTPAAEAQSAAWLAVSPLTLPAPAGASEPNVTVSARGTLLTWVEPNGHESVLKFAERTGDRWSVSKTVASGHDWFLSAADVPSVMRMADGTLVSWVYRSTNVQLEAYDTWLAWSKDEGQTWSTPFKPYRDRTQTQHGFASLFDRPGGGLGLVWLDAREWELNQDAPDGGSVMLRYAAFDPSWKPVADDTVNLRVCDCCQTSVAATPSGIVTAFRDRSENEIRDIAITRLDGAAWTDATPVHHDNWEIDSCPVNGPAISARGNTLAVAWFTAAGGQGHSYAAFSKDAGRTWGQPIRLDEATSTGRVDIEMLDEESAAVSWVEFANQRASLKVRRVSTSGAASAPVDVQPAGSGRVSGYPRLVTSGDSLLFVWTESAAGENADRNVQIKGATARIPR